MAKLDPWPCTPDSRLSLGLDLMRVPLRPWSRSGRDDPPFAPIFVLTLTREVSFVIGQTFPLSTELSHFRHISRSDRRKPTRLIRG